MQKIALYNKNRLISRNQYVKLISRFVLFVFATAFLLQQLQAFSSVADSGFFKKISFQKSKQSQFGENQLSLLPPNESRVAAMEMEVAEDDELSNEQVDLNNFSQHANFKEQVIDCIIRSRYLQLALSVQQQPQVPFFILHHSWKNNLS